MEEVKRRAADELQRARLQREEEESEAKSKEQEQEQQIKEQEAVEVESKGETTVEETNVTVRTGGDASCLHFQKNDTLKARSETVGVARCSYGWGQRLSTSKKKCSPLFVQQSNNLQETLAL